MSDMSEIANLSDEEVLAAGKCIFKVMDRTGDTKTMWDPKNDDEVEVAREQFKALKKKGYAVYRVGERGKKSEVMQTFDPDAGAMILVATPPVQGG